MKHTLKNGAEFSKWYHKVITDTKMVDESPVRGCVVLRPYGYAIWENIQKVMDRKIKHEIEAENAYFPLLIPESFLNKEKDHIEGFSPELAVVTHAGGKKLEEPYVIRPTSETVIYSMFARWITSYRDLPLKINQWANVMRWELRPRPFLRTTEFLWQEGHTAHATEEEAKETAAAAAKVYNDFARDYMAIPGISGQKTASERFAGAKSTATIECMMQDGKALQLCTSHLLAHSFPKAFDITFADQDNNLAVPWCTSWGITTRTIGAIVMVHGDETGLVLPPKLAPIQVVITPILRKNSDANQAVLDKAISIGTDLSTAGVRIKVDSDTHTSPGAKFFAWEQKGVPLRLEIGPKDIEKGGVMMATRIQLDGRDKKVFVPFDELATIVPDTLAVIQAQMLANAENFRNEHSYVFEGTTFEELAKLMKEQPGFYQVGWCQSLECEKRLKEAKASARVIVDGAKGGRICFGCGKPSAKEVIVARSY